MNEAEIVPRGARRRVSRPCAETCITIGSANPSTPERSVPGLRTRVRRLRKRELHPLHPVFRWLIPSKQVGGKGRPIGCQPKETTMGGINPRFAKGGRGRSAYQLYLADARPWIGARATPSASSVESHLFYVVRSRRKYRNPRHPDRGPAFGGQTSVCSSGRRYDRTRGVKFISVRDLVDPQEDLRHGGAADQSRPPPSTASRA